MNNLWCAEQQVTADLFSELLIQDCLLQGLRLRKVFSLEANHDRPEKILIRV